MTTTPMAESADEVAHAAILRAARAAALSPSEKGAAKLAQQRKLPVRERAGTGR